jgi:hypothetical protein
MKCDTVMADDDNTRQWKSIEMFINYLPYMYISVTTASRGVYKLSNIRLYLIILQPCYINADICCFLTSFELKTRLECKYC